MIALTSCYLILECQLCPSMVRFSFLAGARSEVFVVIACLHFHSLSLIHYNVFRFAIFIALTVLLGFLHSSKSILLVRVCTPAFLVFWVRICSRALAAARFTIAVRHLRCIQATSSCLEAIRARWKLVPAEIVAKGLICLNKTAF